MSEQSSAINDFVESVRRVCAEEPAGEARWRRAADELRQLLANEALQEHASTWPAGQGRELILHHDEELGFFVGALVRVPNHKAGAHDHAHTFTVYGVLNGEELTSLFERVDDGSQPGKARIRKTSDIPTPAGMVGVVGPWEIHAESNVGERSVAITLRSEIPGNYDQNVFDEATGTVRYHRGLHLIPFPIA